MPLRRQDPVLLRGGRVRRARRAEAAEGAVDQQDRSCDARPRPGIRPVLAHGQAARGRGARPAAPQVIQSMYIFKQPHIGGEVSWHVRIRPSLYRAAQLRRLLVRAQDRDHREWLPVGHAGRPSRPLRNASCAMAMLHRDGRGKEGPIPPVDQATRTEFGHPRSSIRLRTWAAMVLRDNQNHARCDNQASLPAVSVVQRKLHPGIMMSGCQAGVKPGPLGPRLWRLRA